MLYKYLPQERLDDFIKDRTVRFTQFTALNDPFESSNLILLKNEYKVDEAKLDEKKENLKKIFPSRADSIDKQFADMDRISKEFELPHVQGDMITNYFSSVYGILSLSRNYQSMLMWAHYAGSHTGFVIGMDEKHEFFQDCGEDDFNPALKKVTYRHNRHTITDLKEENVFCDKSLDWSYEEEERVFKLLELGEPKGFKCALDCEVYLFQIPKEAIKEIYFGANMPNDIKSSIAFLVKELLPEVKLFYATLDQKKYALNFDLKQT